MSSPATTIRDYLVDLGLGTTGTPAPGGWLLTASRMPDAGFDRCISVFDSGGKDPDPKFNLNSPAVQVMVRGDARGYDAAYEKAKAIKAALISLPSQQMGDLWLIGSYMRGDIGQVGHDASNRPLLSLNFLLRVQDADPGNRTNL